MRGRCGILGSWKDSPSPLRRSACDPWRSFHLTPQLRPQFAPPGVQLPSLPNSLLQAVQVGTARRILVADPDDLSERGTPQRPGDLHEHTLISSGTFASQPEWRFTKGSKVIIERIRT